MGKYQGEFFGKLEKVEGINPFFQKINEKLLTGLEENRVYSPLNVYLASAMMSETAEYSKIEFKLDRPFVFVVTNSMDDLLFIGVVNNPNE